MEGWVFDRSRWDDSVMALGCFGVINSSQRSAFNCDPFVEKWNIRSMIKIALHLQNKKFVEPPAQVGPVGVWHHFGGSK